MLSLPVVDGNYGCHLLDWVNDVGVGYQPPLCQYWPSKKTLVRYPGNP